MSFCEHCCRRPCVYPKCQKPHFDTVAPKHPECGRDHRSSLEEAAEGIAEMGRVLHGEERADDERVTHRPLRGTLPVWFIRTVLGYCVVAAENEFQAREATKKTCIAWTKLDGVFFNGAGPRVIEELS